MSPNFGVVISELQSAIDAVTAAFFALTESVRQAIDCLVRFIDDTYRWCRRNGLTLPLVGPWRMRRREARRRSRRVRT